MSAPHWGAHQARLYRTLEYLHKHPEVIPAVDNRWMMFKAYLRGRGLDPDDQMVHYIGLCYMEMMNFWGHRVLGGATDSYTQSMWSALTDNIITEITAHMVTGLSPEVRMEMGLPPSIPWDRPNIFGADDDDEDDDDDDDDDGEDDDEEHSVG